MTTSGKEDQTTRRVEGKVEECSFEDRPVAHEAPTKHPTAKEQGTFTWLQLLRHRHKLTFKWNINLVNVVSILKRCLTLFQQPELRQQYEVLRKELWQARELVRETTEARDAAVRMNERRREIEKTLIEIKWRFLSILHFLIISLLRKKC